MAINESTAEQRLYAANKLARVEALVRASVQARPPNYAATTDSAIAEAVAALAVLQGDTPPVEVPWTPAALSQPKAWFVADDPANGLAGGFLTALVDRGGGSPATPNQGDTNNRARVDQRLNGRAVWSVDMHSTGARGYLRTGQSTLATSNAEGMTFFVLHRVTDLGAGPNMVHMDRGNGYHTRLAMTRKDNGWLACGGRISNDLGYNEAIDTTVYDNDWLIAAGITNNADGTARVRANGVETALKSDWQSPGSTNDEPSQFISFGHYTDTNGVIQSPCVGEIAEALIVRGALTLPVLQQIEGYLAWSWGLQAKLPADHPYKLARPLV